MNLQIVEAVKCKGILTQISTCLRCQYFVTRDEILGQIECRNENKKYSREEHIKKCKEFYGNKIIEFGDIDEKP